MRRGWDLKFFSNKRLVLTRRYGPTDGRTDTPSYRDATAYLKISLPSSAVAAVFASIDS